MKIFVIVILTILLFIVFITYGIDEHILVVSLHNIRVFMKRLYATIKKLIQKKSLKDVDWENGSIQHESLPLYRNFKENNTTREEKLLSQLITLEQDKNLLQEKNIEITTEYERKQASLMRKISELEGKFEDVQIENKEYKRILSNLQVVDQNTVASPFCAEHDDMLSLCNDFTRKIFVEYEMLSGSSQKIVMPYLMGVLYNREPQKSPIERWYVLLKETALIPKELTFDITSKSNDSSILEYLQKYAFENYYRVCISAIILFAENVRIRLNKTEQQLKFQNTINDFIQKLRINYSIEVDYVPINTILNDSEYAKYEIETISNGEEENKVISVRKYAVNRSNVYAQSEKSILILNI